MTQLMGMIIIKNDYYKKQIISTFGAPNQWIDSSDEHHIQDFSALRDINSSVNQMVLLNEYDAVRYDEYLKDNGYDIYFGRVEGNGKNWIELVTLVDNLDLRGAELKVVRNNRVYRGKFPNISELSNIRSGTIITVSDQEPTDLSYDPFNECSPDWTINLNTKDLITLEDYFWTNHLDVRVSLKSGSGDIIILPESGEGVIGRDIIGRDEG